METKSLTKNFLIYMLNYLKVVALTPIVLLIASVLIFLMFAYDSTPNFSWLKYLSFINSSWTSGTISFDVHDIMKIFGFLSLIIFILLEIFKRMGVEIKIRPKVVAFALSLPFVLLILITLFPLGSSLSASPEANGLVGVFVFFWAFTVGAFWVWTKLNNATKFIETFLDGFH